MVCCAIITLLLAGLFWPIQRIIGWFTPQKTPPLLWQLTAGPQIDLPPRFSLAARAKSVSYALAGLGFVIRNEHNARIHIAATIVIISLGTIYQIKATDWVILVLAIVSVWFAETINTAFEYLCDVVSPQKNESVRRAKDIAAGAVLITAIGAVIIGAIVMFPYIQDVFQIGKDGISYETVFANNLCLAR